MDPVKKQTIAILGATSHIAKGLINNFLRQREDILHLYSRSADRVYTFLDKLGEGYSRRCVIHEDYEDFVKNNYNVIINCIGIGTLNKHHGDYASYFTVIEEYDNLVINYLRANHSDTLYISFSSGAIYGKNYLAPMDENTTNNIGVNHVQPEDYYAIARLNAEAKHRAFKDLNIVDLRVFSYFSRFADLADGYLITEIINHIIDKKIFITNDLDIMRDYLHPDDLFTAIQKCIKISTINTAFDVNSAKPVTKKEIISYFSQTYGLKCQIDLSFKYKSASGNKNIYYSVFNKAAEIGFRPKYSSMDTIKQESKLILDNI